MHGFQFEMCTFQLKMRAFHFEKHKTADFHSNILVSMKCVIERPLPDMVIFCLLIDIYW